MLQTAYGLRHEYVLLYSKPAKFAIEFKYDGVASRFKNISERE